MRDNSDILEAMTVKTTKTKKYFIDGVEQPELESIEETEGKETPVFNMMSTQLRRNKEMRK